VEEVEIDTFSSSTKNSETFRETFERVFPFYLSIGMTYDQFWNDDVELVKYYREAYKMKQERMNEELWLQGLYIYKAVETVVYNGWCRGKSDKAETYLDKPIPITEQQIEEQKQLKRQEEEARAMVWMNQFVSAYSKVSQEP